MVIQDYGAREDRLRREEWKDYHLQQLMRWKQIAMTAVGVTSAVGMAIGGTTAVVAGAAAGLARGAVVAAMGTGGTTTGVLMDQQSMEANIPVDVNELQAEALEVEVSLLPETPQLTNGPVEPSSASNPAVLRRPALLAQGSRMRSRSVDAQRIVSQAQLEASGHCTKCHDGTHRAQHWMGEIAEQYRDRSNG